MTTGPQVRPRIFAMKAVFVPLPDPGAPPLNRMLPPDGSLPLGRRPIRRRTPSNEQEDQP